MEFVARPGSLGEGADQATTPANVPMRSCVSTGLEHV